MLASMQWKRAIPVTLALSIASCGTTTSPVAVSPRIDSRAGDRAQLLFQDDPEDVTTVDAALAIARLNLPAVASNETLTTAATHLLGQSVPASASAPGIADVDYVAPAGTIALTDIAVIVAAIPLSAKERAVVEFGPRANRLLGSDLVGNILRRPGVLEALPTPTPSSTPTVLPIPSPSALPTSVPTSIPTLPPLPAGFGVGTGTLTFDNVSGANVDTSTFNDAEAIAVRTRSDDGVETVSVSLVEGDRFVQISISDPGSVVAGTYDIGSSSSQAIVIFQEDLDASPLEAKQFFSQDGGSITVNSITETSLNLTVNAVRMQAPSSPISFVGAGQGSFVFNGSAEFDNLSSSQTSSSQM